MTVIRRVAEAQYAIETCHGRIVRPLDISALAIVACLCALTCIACAREDNLDAMQPTINLSLNTHARFCGFILASPHSISSDQ